MDHGEYTWNVDQATLQQMKICKNEDEFLSPTFDIAGLSWRAKSYPDGWKRGNDGSFDVFVQLLYTPAHWDHIECCVSIQCIETMSSYTFYQQCKKETSSGIAKNVMLFSEIEPLDSLSFIIKIFVHRIVLKKDNLVFYERDNVASHQSVTWSIDKNMLQKLKSAHIGKVFYSDIYGGMYAFRFTRKKSHIGFHTVLCTLPKGKRKLDLSWTVKTTLNGDDFEKVINNSYSHELTMQGLGDNSWGTTTFMAIEDVVRSDSMVISIHITANNAEKVLNHWNQLAQRPNLDDEKEEQYMDTTNVFKTDDSQQSDEHALDKGSD